MCVFGEGVVYGEGDVQSFYSAGMVRHTHVHTTLDGRWVGCLPECVCVCVCVCLVRESSTVRGTYTVSFYSAGMVRHTHVHTTLEGGVLVV